MSESTPLGGPFRQKTLGLQLARAFSCLRKLLRQEFLRNGHDVTPEQWVVLNQLYLNGGMSQSQLAELAYKDKPTVTRILANMERKEMVVRGRDTMDRRRHRVYLTDKGRDLRVALHPIVKNTLDLAVQGLTADEQAILHGALETMVRNLDENTRSTVPDLGGRCVGED